MGSVRSRKRKNGKKSYQAQIRIENQEITKTFQRKTDADHWVQQVEVQIRRGEFLSLSEAKKRSFGELIDKYIEDRVVHFKSPQTPRQNLLWWKKHFGNLPLHKITSPLLKEKWDELARTPSSRTGKLLSNRTLNAYIQPLSSMFNIAIKEYGWTRDNPVQRIQKKKLNNARTRFLDEDELRRFFRAVEASSNDYLKVAVLISFSTGARKSNVLSLKWTDINLDTGRVVFRETKNGETVGGILAGQALDVVRKLKKEKGTDSQYVFAKRKSGWKNGRAKIQKPYEDLTNPFRKVLEEAGIVDFRWHDMRHCVASNLIKKGATLTEVGKILGHRSPQMTWRYSHLTKSKSESLVRDMMDDLLEAA